jgi:hypothetical protein
VEWISGLGYCLHLFLDITGHEGYSTFANIAFGVGQSVGVLVQGFSPQNSLIYVGICRATLATFHVLGSGFIVVWWGWLDQYNSGFADLPFRVCLIFLKESSLEFVSGSRLCSSQ